MSKDDPEGHCLPPDVPRMMYTPYPTEILQLPERIVFVYEGGAHVWRNIWMDGRKQPVDPTIEDPDYYTKPWTVVTFATWFPNREILEYICQENNRDLQHLVGKGK
jgi:hypothetical protein